MNKSFTRLGVFLFSLWGILMLSCNFYPIGKDGKFSGLQKNPKSTQSNNLSPIDKNKQNSPGNTKFVQANKGITTAKKTTREQAFAEVVNALHAPYSKGDKFFRIFTAATEETKEGSAVSVKDGDDSIGGKGTWTVKAGKDATAGKDKDDSIVYTYEEFQPKGSKISINGKMISMYRSKSTDGKTTGVIGFHKNGFVLSDNGNTFTYTDGTKAQLEIGVNGVKEIESGYRDEYVITLADVLNIDGEYQAKLEFIYPAGAIHSNVTEDNYKEKLMEDERGMFTEAGSYIEFTYNGETKKLTKDEIKKLITIA